MKKIFECLLVFIAGGAFCNAQQAISTAGGDIGGAGGSVSFTVGQTAYMTLTGSSGTAIQGVQQPFEILVATGNEKNEITLDCQAYPNPASDLLILKIQRDRIENLSYRLMDMNGKILEEKAIENIESLISLKDYSATYYFLIVTDNKKEIKTFKIIKN